MTIKIKLRMAQAPSSPLKTSRVILVCKRGRWPPMASTRSEQSTSQLYPAKKMGCIKAQKLFIKGFKSLNILTRSISWFYNRWCKPGSSIKLNKSRSTKLKNGIAAKWNSWSQPNLRLMRPRAKTLTLSQPRDLSSSKTNLKTESLDK